MLANAKSVLPTAQRLPTRVTRVLGAWFLALYFATGCGSADDSGQNGSPSVGGSAGAGGTSASEGGRAGAPTTGGAGGVGGAGAAGGPTERQACDDFFAAFCEKSAACQKTTKLYGNGMSCADYYSAGYCPWVLFAEGSNETPSEVEACVAAYPLLDCEAVENDVRPPGCSIAGDLPTGAPCAAATQCASFNCVRPSQSTFCGQCQPFAEAGESCDSLSRQCDYRDNLWCDDQTHTCVKQTGAVGQACSPVACNPGLVCADMAGGDLRCAKALASGAACDPNERSCGAGLTCHQNISTGDSTCTPAAKKGASCENADCSPGLLCDPTQICVDFMQTLGQPCGPGVGICVSTPTLTLDCESPAGSKVPVCTRVGVGHACGGVDASKFVVSCGPEQYCKSGKTPGEGTCVEAPAAGEPCGFAGNSGVPVACGLDTYCKGGAEAGKGVCSALPGVGATCNFKDAFGNPVNACLDGARCKPAAASQSGLCTAPGKKGEACDRDDPDACQSPLTCLVATCVQFDPSLCR